MGRVCVYTLLGLLVAGPAWSASVADKCEADKLKTAGKYGNCRLKTHSKEVKKGIPQDEKFAKCDTKYDTKWAKIETRANAKALAKEEPSCPSLNDANDIQARILVDVDDLTTLLSGGTVIDQVCPATGQTTCWDNAGLVTACADTGQDGDVQAGAALSYVDNGDGTMTDLITGLMWEKASDDGSIHDKDTTYSWDNAFAVHVSALNDPNAPFAGHTDWRVPNYKELVSILDLERFSPSIDPIFETGCTPGCTVTTCSCTASQVYWSSTSDAASPPAAWRISFDDGEVKSDGKDNQRHVRAVRGAL